MYLNQDVSELYYTKRDSVLTRNSWSSSWCGIQRQGMITTPIYRDKYTVLSVYTLVVSEREGFPNVKIWYIRNGNSNFINFYFKYVMKETIVKMKESFWFVIIVKWKNLVKLKGAFFSLIIKIIKYNTKGLWGVLSACTAPLSKKDICLYQPTQKCTGLISTRTQNKNYWCAAKFFVSCIHWVCTKSVHTQKCPNLQCKQKEHLSFGSFLQFVYPIIEF